MGVAEDLTEQTRILITPTYESLGWDWHDLWARFTLILSATLIAGEAQSRQNNQIKIIELRLIPEWPSGKATLGSR